MPHQVESMPLRYEHVWLYHCFKNIGALAASISVPPPWPARSRSNMLVRNGMTHKGFNATFCRKLASQLVSKEYSTWARNASAFALWARNTSRPAQSTARHRMRDVSLCTMQNRRTKTRQHAGKKCPDQHASPNSSTHPQLIALAVVSAKSYQTRRALDRADRLCAPARRVAPGNCGCSGGRRGRALRGRPLGPRAAARRASARRRPGMHSG